MKFNINTKAYFPAYEFSVYFISFQNVLECLMCEFMNPIDVHVCFPLQEVDKILHPCIFMSVLGS
jgi:hypothetical protein